MDTNIQNFIEACEWGASKFLIFSDNVFGQLIYYSHLLPLILSLFVGFFVLSRGTRFLNNRLLFIITFLFSIWAFLDLVLWANESPRVIMFSWALILLVETMIYAFSVYFLCVFIEQRDLSIKEKIAIFLPTLPVVLLLPTDFVLVGFDLTNCYREAVEGPIATYYIYFIEILYVLWIVDFSLRRYKDADIIAKKQITLITIGVVLFLSSFVSANIVGSLTENWNLAQVGLLSMPIFITFLAYLIVKFKVFNIRVIGAEILVFASGFLVFGMIFIRRIENVRFVALATLVLIAVVGYLLVRGVRKDIQQKEELSKLNIELQNLLKQRESLVHLVTHKVKGSFTRSKYIFAGMLDGTFGEISDDVRKYASQGLESNNMGIETVDLVLNADNLQKGIVKYDMKPFDLKEIALRVVAEKEPSIKAKGLDVATEVGEGDFKMLGDSFWIKEVVNNLMENSIKYTLKGKITLTLESLSGKLRLGIKDTGVGINPDDKKLLFTEGGRGKDSVKINVDSTGYGLYSVKLIADAHKARVWAESEGPGKGSQFYVEFDALKA